MSRFSRCPMALGLCLSLCIGPRTAQAEEAIEPVRQQLLNDLVANGRPGAAFKHAFEAGDALTEFNFAAEQGVGANIGEGRRFTRFPRADLKGPGEWARHFPAREGGANATRCISCHSSPIANGAGGVAMNVVLDPNHTGDPKLYLERNTTPMFALGIPQRLAEEMTLELYRQRDDARFAACETGGSTVKLTAKGVSFGTLSVTRTTATPCVVDIETSGLTGIDADLVVRPFGWKGNHATLRSFTRAAAHNELGLQGTELVGGADGDFDGVTAELSVGDMTALTIYMAALERPVRRTELHDLGLLTLPETQARAIAAGEDRFAAIGCASCHTPQMTLNDPVFREPSLVPGYFDARFPDGSDPTGHGLRRDTPVSFDMRVDQPNNLVMLDTGEAYHLGALEVDSEGRGVAHWFTDFKRHDMGAALSDPSDPMGIGAAMFLTRSLAGVGSTGPWLHDGRATSLNEAILAHGGEAAQTRDGYVALPDEARAELVAFLKNLIIYQADATH
ncbi:di-heme oxidoredictase family protein [Antarctobacter heliothermus]|uniref:Di-haem oxidoreductase, putative peroxidase n=1 Tax=Antarctobacter heliothermus TaxID=74033 RepID=A0A239FTM1_9RHOB|nr:di-heme oxidoredictase family protein [Antarctobacter heliothermus]SNS59502.1 Di-haem oxidoreductase, putative peroxidase [Antarctobacter heliothermus]